MSKYIDADKLIAEIKQQRRLIEGLFLEGDNSFYEGVDNICCHFLGVIEFLQQEQPKKTIEINGIRYKEVPAKTDDKICKDCDYFLDNGICNLDACPCACDDNILERIQQEQPELPNNERKGIPGKDYIPVVWVDACEMYGKWKIVRVEQSDVDLEKEIDALWNPRFNLGWDEKSLI